MQRMFFSQQQSYHNVQPQLSDLLWTLFASASACFLSQLISCKLLRTGTSTASKGGAFSTYPVGLHAQV